MDILFQTKSTTAESDHLANALALLESSLCPFNNMHAISPENGVQLSAKGLQDII